MVGLVSRVVKRCCMRGRLGRRDWWVGLVDVVGAVDRGVV